MSNVQLEHTVSSRTTRETVSVDNVVETSDVPQCHVYLYKARTLCWQHPANPLADFERSLKSRREWCGMLLHSSGTALMTAMTLTHRRMVGRMRSSDVPAPQLRQVPYPRYLLPRNPAHSSEWESAG